MELSKREAWEQLVQDLYNLIPPYEGEFNQTYGRIGEGKTYDNTRSAINLLKQGQVVYTNWPIYWEGYDERNSLWKRILYKLHLKNSFLVVPKENWHYYELRMSNVREFIAGLTDCTIFADEGHWIFDSYTATKMPLEDRMELLSVRHIDKTINIISQRPSAIHVVIRGNVNRFYKIEKLKDFSIFGKRFIQFMKTEFQDVDSNEKPDETRVKVFDKDTGTFIETREYQYAVSVEKYWGRKKIFKMYDTKFLRKGRGHSQPQYAHYVGRGAWSDIMGTPMPLE